jgi:F-type H+-transporting ATPase subunit b
MLIDWFTVFAQALNFMVLVWLLRRFLYKPVLAAIAAREKKVAAELADAAAKQSEASGQRDEFQRKNDGFDASRAALFKKAADDAGAERERLLAEARAAADALRDRRREALRSDAQNLNQAIRRRAQDEVFAVARKALADLSTTTLEASVAEVFIRRVRCMDDATKATLAEAVSKDVDPLVVRSAFELPEPGRAAIQDTLNRTFSADVRVRFETAPALVGGIECATNGHKVGWSISEYLGSLESGVAVLLKDKETARAKAEPKPRPADVAVASPPGAGAGSIPDAAHAPVAVSASGSRAGPDSGRGAAGKPAAGGP